MFNERLKPPNPNKVLDAVQVMMVPISVGVSIILGQTQVPGLVLTASYTFAGGNLAVLVFRKIAGLLPPPKK
ncbi:MAG: hypothetical protein WC741_00585 [Patescibacteria group bacterium]|jgi:hypothetical protein